MEVPEMRVVSPFVGSEEPVTAPAIDGVEARWAADAVASLLRQLPLDSVVGMVLRNTHRELTCLARSADAGAPEVIGPFRVRAAA
jgi:hypothetical protein